MHLKMTLRNRRPAWDSRPSTMRRPREAQGGMSHVMIRNKDKRAEELIVVEEQTRSVRFERERIFPIWWFDYASQKPTSKDSPPLQCVDIPGLGVDRSDWIHGRKDRVMTLKVKADREMNGFPICLWGIPTKWEPDRSRIQTNAEEAISVRNTGNEFHLVLFFNLKREMEVRIRIINAAAIPSSSPQDHSETKAS